MTSEEKIARVNNIVDEINVLLAEAMKIAEEEKVVVDFDGLLITSAYGVGGLHYVPAGEGIKDFRFDDRGITIFEDQDECGWVSSASDRC